MCKIIFMFKKHFSSAVKVFLLHVDYSETTEDEKHDATRSTQPCIPPGSLNRVPASAGVRAGMSRLPGGR